MERGTQGTFSQVGKSFKAFIPHDLPPKPPLVYDKDMIDLLEQANRALGQLDGISMILPDILIFLYFYIRKEAVLSSQVEGTQSSLSDLLLFEIKEVPGVPLDDVLEVSNYVAALDVGHNAIKSDEIISMRLIKQLHSILLSRGRGCDKNPGEYRRSQNWIQGTGPENAVFVPPPYSEVGRLMGQLEKFINDKPERTPALVKAALAHVQFETIHAFLDGNGRLGRLLITLILLKEKAIENPLLYLSLYFKSNRDEYYALLNKTRTTGDWEAWLRFFLEGVKTTSKQAFVTAKQIRKTFEEDRCRIQALGKSANSALRVHQLLQSHPLITVPEIAKQTELSKPTANTVVQRLQELGIVRQATQKKKGRLFVYDKYLAILNEGTEPLR
ncbi:MAG: Fic family protein [Armatimonadota bacterium]|jgi:Fic family protein